MHTTIALTSAGWDLTLDSAKNIALQADSQAVSQDVASVLRTFQGECWYDTGQGLPYFTQILGEGLNTPLFAAAYNAAALTVPDVVKAQTTFTALTVDRKLSGTVEVIDTYGQSINAHF